MNEPVTGRRGVDAPWLVNMAVEEIGGETEGSGEAFVIGSSASSGKEIRKGEHAIGVRGTRFAADRAARFRRYVDKFAARTRRPTSGKIQAEAEIVQYREFEAHEQFAGVCRVLR